MYPDAIITVFGMNIDLYDICMTVGMFACMGILYYAMSYKKFNAYSSDVLAITLIFGIIFGLLFGFVFQGLYSFIDDPSGGFRLAGMTVMGGMLGGTASFLLIYSLFIYVIHPRTKIKWLSGKMNATLTDALPFIPVGISAAQALGRLGCFFAGCCYGKPTDAWYGLPCAFGYDGNVIPTQLFEMIFLALLCAAMAVLFFKYDFKYNFSVYTVAYGVWRFIIEFARDDYRGELFGSTLSPSQIWSIVWVLFGIGYVFLQKYVLVKHMKRPELARASAGNAATAATAAQDSSAAPAEEQTDAENAPVEPQAKAAQEQAAGGGEEA